MIAPLSGSLAQGGHAMTPTQRTLAYLRSAGYVAALVERYEPHSRTRHDAFGIGDLLAAHPRFGIVLLQVTTGSHHAYCPFTEPPPCGSPSSSP